MATNVFAQPSKGALFALTRRAPTQGAVHSSGMASSRILSVGAVRWYAQAPALPKSAVMKRHEARSRGRYHFEKVVPASVEAAMQDSMTDTVYDDIGLFPETFVMPTGANKPGLFSDTRIRLTLEWHRIKTKVMMVVRSLFVKWFQARELKPSIKLGWWSLSSVGLDLYKTMNSSLASGDIGKLGPAVTEGLLSTLRSQISRRSTDSKITWGFTKSARSRLILDTITKLPYEGPESPIPSENVHLLRQAVVRIDGEQELRQGKVETSGKVKWNRMPVVSRKPEYIVIQQVTLRGNTGPWKIWGTTRETTVPDFLSMREKQGHQPSTEPNKPVGGLF